MLDRIWELLKNSDNLMDEAWREALTMLGKCEQMYDMVTHALRQAECERVLVKVAQMDREVNDHQREARKKVFEQLAVGRGGDLLRGLQLMAIVIDLERIGDYTKNIGELAELICTDQGFGDQSDAYDEVHDVVQQMFVMTQKALREPSVDDGKAVMDLYPKVSRRCDATMREILGSDDPNCRFGRSDISLVLLLRYMKRVAAHLKNVCSAIVNPIHQIGFKDGLT